LVKAIQKLLAKLLQCCLTGTNTLQLRWHASPTTWHSKRDELSGLACLECPAQQLGMHRVPNGLACSTCLSEMDPCSLLSEMYDCRFGSWHGNLTGGRFLWVNYISSPRDAPWMHCHIICLGSCES